MLLQIRLGDWSIQAIGSGLAFQQTNPVPGNFGSYSGISNLQVDIQKTNGPITVYLQAGTYAIPSIGMPYTRTCLLYTSDAADE